MKLKTILFILLFISNVFASAIDIQNLTSEQLETLKKIKEKGENAFNYAMKNFSKNEGVGKMINIISNF